MVNDRKQLETKNRLFKRFLATFCLARRFVSLSLIIALVPLLRCRTLYKSILDIIVVVSDVEEVDPR
jgi:hypothetical protein